MTDRLSLIETLVADARRAGADAAEAILVSGTSLGIQVRQGRSEELERSEHNDVGLRVFVGSRSAIVSATSIDPAGFGRLIEQALAMARVSPRTVSPASATAPRPVAFRTMAWIWSMPPSRTSPP